MRAYRKLGAVMMVLAVVVLSAWTMFLTTSTVKVVGPFYTNPIYDSSAAGQVGGKVQIYTAGDTVRIGQVVYLSARNTVKASATISDYNALAGIVVGGARTAMQASVSVADTSTIAAIGNQKVIVLKQGRYWVLDSTGAITTGTQVRPSGTKGRMAARLSSLDSLRRIFGRTVDTTISGKAGLVDINIP